MPFLFKDKLGVVLQLSNFYEIYEILFAANLTLESEQAELSR